MPNYNLAKKILETWPTLKEKIIRINQRKEEIQINQLSSQDQKIYKDLKNSNYWTNLNYFSRNEEVENVLLSDLLKLVSCLEEKDKELEATLKSIENL